jgi:hypothetical protein
MTETVEQQRHTVLYRSTATNSMQQQTKTERKGTERNND